MYDPAIGRWLSEDPIGFDAADPNLFRYNHNDPVNRTDPSGLYESDDRENAPGNRRLVNVREQLEGRVNSVINRLRDEYRGQLVGIGESARAAATERIGREFVAAVYAELGADDPESGVRVGRIIGTRGPVAHIETWLKDNLDSGANQINQVSYRQSRYRFNNIDAGVLSVHRPYWMRLSTDELAGAFISPTIRIDDTLMGIDKWGHFFQQGYWLFDLSEGPGRVLNGDSARESFCNILEGNTAGIHGAVIDRYSSVMRNRYQISPGRHGTTSAGVISHADIAANLAGYQFYSDLYQDFVRGTHSFQFRAAAYNPRRFNEATVTPNTFVRGMTVDDSDRPWFPSARVDGVNRSSSGRSTSGISCFVAGTEIATSSARKPVEKIIRGDKVWSLDPHTGSVRPKSVWRSMSAMRNDLCILEGPGWQVNCSPEHPFLTSENIWKLALQIMAGDKIMTARGEVSVRLSKHVSLRRPVMVHNFSVEETQTYCVTPLGLVVHNK